MSSRTRMLLGALLVLGAGVALGRLSAPGPPPAAAPPAPPTVHAVPANHPAAAPRTCPDPDPALARRVAELEQALAAQEFLNRSLDEEANGTPIPWPDDLPFAFTPEGFRHNLARAIAACDLGIAPVDIDCSEPPCLAAIAGATAPISDEDGWYTRLTRDCPQWTGTYGLGHNLWSGSSRCDDGRPRELTLLGVPLPDDGPRDLATVENQGKRWDARIRAAQADWGCAEP